jgi:hypothetical protein
MPSTAELLLLEPIFIFTAILVMIIAVVWENFTGLRIVVRGTELFTTFPTPRATAPCSHYELSFIL